MYTKLFYLIMILAVSLTLVGCSSSELTKFSEDSSCKTTIEGNYYKVAIQKYSQLYLKMEKHPKKVLGSLISFDSTNAVFVPVNMQMGDSDTSVVPVDTIYGLVDKFGNVLQGEIPEFWKKDLNEDLINHKLWIGLTDIRTELYYELRLQPNEPFAYCINPGVYEVTLLDFYEDRDIADKGYDFGKIIITIKPGIVNYLGNIYADYRTKDDENIILVPCSYYNGGAQSAAGQFGGFLGSLVYTIANEISNSDLHHVIHIERDNNFIPEANLDVSDVEISVTMEEE
ncbi:MAG: hypothetical protein IPM56_08040 [Ignavibacteriales bacterium]|nr:MAG: hypothetical protein IPM56_08040 [Ignavibacteriales bacterium]